MTKEVNIKLKYITILHGAVAEFQIHDGNSLMIQMIILNLIKL